MRLHLVRHLWGVTDAPEVAFPRFKAAGFAAVEFAHVFYDPAALAALRAAADAHGLRLLPMVYTMGQTVDEHLASFRAQAMQAAGFAPPVINAHTGQDRWSSSERLRFYREVAAICRDLPCPLAHETHRSRCFFSPWSTLEVIEAVPELWLTADFSRWCVVAERLLDDGDAPVLSRIFPRVRHLHARVGHSQGPQVSDPRAPEWAEALAAHERWWDAIWAEQERAGLAATTLTPEFGPPPYMPTLPHTRQPVADLAEICQWQADRQAQRFAARHQSAASVAR
jgi:hypothetical protein